MDKIEWEVVKQVVKCFECSRLEFEWWSEWIEELKMKLNQ